MTSRSFTTIASMALGALLLGSVATVAAAEDQVVTDGVDVNVSIASLGALAMTVASDATTLAEYGSDATARVFTGSLPTVTVTDTRDPETVPDGAYWYVVGTASDFTSSSGDTIAAANLGWNPNLIDGGDSGLVAEGDQVDPALDGGPGLVDQELLAMAADSASVAEEGAWKATANLKLKTPVNVEPGNYTSTITLSLFE